MRGCDRPAFIGTAGQQSMPGRGGFIRLFAEPGIHVGIEHLQRVMQRIAAGNYTFRSAGEFQLTAFRANGRNKVKA